MRVVAGFSLFQVMVNLHHVICNVAFYAFKKIPQSLLKLPTGVLLRQEWDLSEPLQILG